MNLYAHLHSDTYQIKTLSAARIKHNLAYLFTCCSRFRRPITSATTTYDAIFAIPFFVMMWTITVVTTRDVDTDVY